MKNRELRFKTYRIRGQRKARHFEASLSGHLNVNSQGILDRERLPLGNPGERTHQLTENQASFLAHVIALRQRRFPDTSFVFVYRNGTKIHRNRISDQVREARRALGLSEDLVPYGLRHSLITLLDEMGIGVSKIQTIAGHRRVGTTMGYIHSPDESLRNVVDLAEKARQRGRTG